MGTVTDLLARPVYGMTQVDRLLALRSGTARRWIDGYERRGKWYPPVVRDESTGDDIVTWGEFVEARLLAEYRDKGVPMVRMRPAILALRREFGPHPLARARPFVKDRELVHEVQQAVGLDRALVIVVQTRSGQVLLSDPAARFHRSVEYSTNGEAIVERVHPLSNSPQVVVDPLRQFGEPVVRSVPTEVLAEQFDAGDSIEAIAELHELDHADVEAALRYERERIKALNPSAA